VGCTVITFLLALAPWLSPIPLKPPLTSVSRSRSTSATPVAPTSGHTTTITKGVDANGNEITKKDTYREGIIGSSQAHTKTFTDPDGVADK
jgi:hypothetical protein